MMTMVCHRVKVTVRNRIHETYPTKPIMQQDKGGTPSLPYLLFDAKAQVISSVKIL